MSEKLVDSSTEIAERAARRIYEAQCDRGRTFDNAMSFDGILAEVSRAIEDSKSDDTRELLKRFVDKLKVILPKVDGFIALASIRAGQDLYDGPNLADEMQDAERVLSGSESKEG
jgi:hypothetical protein